MEKDGALMVNAENSSNAESEIAARPRIAIELSGVHSMNTPLPIVVMEFEITIEVKDV